MKQSQPWARRLLSVLLSAALTITAIGGAFPMNASATPATDRPEDADIEYLRLHNHNGPSGVPLGGIGVGYMELDPTGTFTRNGFGNIHHSYADTPDGMFLSLWEEGKGAVRLQRDDKNTLGMTGYTDSYYTGLMPSAKLEFEGNDKVGVKASYTAYSGLTAQNIKDSALPVIYFDVELENPSNESKDVSAAISWGDLIGRGLRDTTKYNDADFNEDGTSSSWSFMTPPETAAEDVTVGSYTGVRQYAKDPSKLTPNKWTFQNYNTDCTILAEKQAGTEVSVLKQYNVNDTAAWDSYRQNGSFSNTTGTAHLSDGGDPEKTQSASAVSVKTTLGANEKKTVRFMVSWFMPEPDYDAVQAGPEKSRLTGTDYSKYYHNFFQNIGELNAYAVTARQNVRAGIDEWQKPILDSNMPDWLKFKQINSGFTLYTNTVLNKKKVFSCLEGEMGGLGGTMDQKMSSHPVYQKLFTELDNNENQSFANTQGAAGDILHYNVHYYNGVADYDPANKNTPTPSGSMIDNSAAWIMQLLKTYQQTGDKSYIEMNYDVLKKAVAFVKSKCPAGANIPQYGTTYDDASHPQLFIYAGTIYLSMLQAAEKVARIMQDTATADQYHEMFLATQADIQKLYVTEGNGGYYAFGTDKDWSNRQEDIIFSGQLAGQFMSRYSGWGDILPHENTVNSMKKILTTSVQNANDYYAPKIYNWVTGQSLDGSGSRCWPFYLDSYTAMEAIQLGYLEDGLEIMEHTQLVHFRKGYTWTQNLWNPNYATYMTAPVVWFINDVLAGAAIDVNEKTLTLGPSAIPGEGKLVTPLYYPNFWANLVYDETNRTASLEIIKTFGEENITFEKLVGMPAGKPSDEAKTVNLSAPFQVKEGAKLDLTPYFDTISGAETIEKVLQPVPSYKDNQEPERIAKGTGLRGDYYNNTTFSGESVNRIDEKLDFTWGEEGPAEGITSDGYSVKWTGAILPRYGQKYLLKFHAAGGVKVKLNNEVILDELTSTETKERVCEIMLEAGKLYPIEIQYVKPAGVDGAFTFKWWSTTQTEEVVIKQRLYPPFSAYETISALDFSDKKGSVQIEGGSNLGFIKNGDSITFAAIDFGDGMVNGAFSATVAVPAAGSSIELYLGDTDGRKLATLDTPATGGFGNYKEFTVPVPVQLSGIQQITLKFVGTNEYICNMTQFRFTQSMPAKYDVTLKAENADKYLVAEHGGSEPICADRDAASTAANSWELFNMEFVEGNKFVFTTGAYGQAPVMGIGEKYGIANVLYAKDSKASDANYFELVETSEGKVAIQHQASGKYLVVNEGTVNSEHGEIKSLVSAGAETLEDAETFLISGIDKPVSMKISDDADRVDTGKNLQMKVNFAPLCAEQKTVSWSVTDHKGAATDKATISDDGLLTAVKGGTIKVTARAEGKYGPLTSTKQIAVYHEGVLPVEKEDLEGLVSDYEAISEKAFTAASYKPFKEALDAAKAILARNDATQSEIDDAYDRLDAARRALVPIQADRTALDTLLKDCESIKESDYTPASYASFAIAYAAAKGLPTNATQAQVDAIVAKLTAAKAALVKRPAPVEQKNGWKLESGGWYYYVKDVKQTGWLYDQSKWYFLESNGKMVAGWKQVGGKWYFFESSGKMVTGWKQVGGKWYYFEWNGKMATGWKQIGGKWYFLESSGKMVTGWKQFGKTWYFFESSGKMTTGWRQLGKKWYFFASNGKMATGWQKVGGKWYLLDGNGVMKTGWQKVGNKWYFMEGSGKMVGSTSKVLGGKTYRFAASGVCLNP